MHPLKMFKGKQHSWVEEFEPCGAFVMHGEFCSLGKVWKGLLSGRALPGNGNSSESSPRVAKDPSSLPKCWNGLGLELDITVGLHPKFEGIPWALGALDLSGFLGDWSK